MRKLVTVMEERRSIQRYSSEGGVEADFESQRRGMARDGDRDGGDSGGNSHWLDVCYKSASLHLTDVAAGCFFICSLTLMLPSLAELKRCFVSFTS